MSGLMFGEMFRVLEYLTALLATVLVSRHGNPPTRIPHVVLTRYSAGDMRHCSLVQETPLYAPEGNNGSWCVKASDVVRLIWCGAISRATRRT